MFILNSSLTGLRPSVVCSNFMGGGVTAPSSGHIAVSLRPYIIFINNSHLLLIQLQTIFPPPLIPKIYALLLPPVHDFWGSFLPLLSHNKVKNWPCSDVLIHNFLMVGYIIPNFSQPLIHHHLTNVGVPPFYILGPRNQSINPPHHLIMQAPQRSQYEGCYNSHYIFLKFRLCN